MGISSQKKIEILNQNETGKLRKTNKSKEVK